MTRLFHAGLKAGRTRQKGVFTIELALVGSVIILFLAFISDMVGKQALEGQLQRLSYSAASIIKERTQLYSTSASEIDALDDVQVNQLYRIVRDSMGRTNGDFKETSLGMRLEQLKYHYDSTSKTVKPAPLVSYARGLQGCQPELDLSSHSSDLKVGTSDQSGATLYQVTLCYQGNNWFGSMVGEDYSTVRAYSIMIGR
ncbi:hypothetical protein M3P05_16200 [Sansalvadorimonas sp. 2012CJ34-2]|uniref:Uncharacterized protein n=1 Tax=Parendozoicomonas callyspongiae TaxID=2942213 RepID=A0ABT0PJA5_9GAMM|nr:tight adherence pilus pseudopilin TadF [Sansalvadorimonas sp. 2012CJ34-2]MCL6271464.1 hypothetical protein [Sansalvadorimonas sp. 2012CJ34-2]